MVANAQDKTFDSKVDVCIADFIHSNSIPICVT